MGRRDNFERYYCGNFERLTYPTQNQWDCAITRTVSKRLSPSERNSATGATTGRDQTNTNPGRSRLVLSPRLLVTKNLGKHASDVGSSASAPPEPLGCSTGNDCRKQEDQIDAQEHAAELDRDGRGQPVVCKPCRTAAKQPEQRVGGDDVLGGEILRE